ncbi:MAG: MarR family winged helix-turn-helix transcriptional regulator [Janthinobacterium lividum]
MTARYDQALAGSGLSSAQFEVLSTLRALGQANGRALAEQLAVDPTTLSRNLKVLIREKLIAARRSGVDARQTDYSLTAKGLKRLEIARPLWETAHADTQGRLGVDAELTQHVLLSIAERLRT